MMFRNGEEEYVEMEITSSVTFMGSGKLLWTAAVYLCSICYLLYADLDPEGGDDIFLRNVGSLSADYTLEEPG
jgi:hypothetical protein